MDLYKKASRSKYEQLAFDYLVNNTLKDKLRGNDKLKELPGFNMEESMPLQIVPTMFYTFMYDSAVPENIRNISFIDRVPLILCLHYENDDVTGINFNLLPTDVRASILDIIYGSNENYYKTAKPDRFSVNTALASVLMTKEGIDKFILFLEAKTGIPIRNSIRHYKKGKMKNIRMIEYDMWQYIPFLVFKDAVRGANLANIQTEIIKKSANK